MCCEQIKGQIGRYVDKELSAKARDEIEAHLKGCASCRAELEEIRELGEEIGKPVPLPLPDSLWSNIERRLDQTDVSASPTPSRLPRRMWRTPWAIAAAMALLVGLGLFGLSSLDTTAQASTVDFGVLLDALPLDAQKAFRKFLIRYDARPTTPQGAKRVASKLNFETPAELPGGFRLQSVYELRIGDAKGIAAGYARKGEFLAVVFHPPMMKEKFGSHENYPCVIGEHCGHQVRVGEWKLVHFTDPTTCHCLLSRLDQQTEMPLVMKAIAPTMSTSLDAHNH